MEKPDSPVPSSGYSNLDSFRAKSKKGITQREVAYFSSVYFVEEHNFNAPTMWYNVDEEPPCSDLTIF
jgi:hypothetical protein